MLTNPEILKDAYKCDRDIARYLVVTCKIPILGYDDNKNIYFARTKQLEESLNRMPLKLRLLSIFRGRR